MANNTRDENDITHNGNKENMKIRPWHLLKLTDYYFTGKSEDVDVYFEWEHKMNVFFALCDCPEFEKVSTAAAQLTEDAQNWWNKEIIEGKHFGFMRQPSWEAMQNFMRKQYIPRDQYQDIRKQFQTLRQGDKTIMEYQRQFKYLRIRLNPGVSSENIMNHFVDGLNDDIRFQLQECKCNDLEEIFQQTIQIEIITQMKSMAMEKTDWSKHFKNVDQDLRTNPFEEGEYDEVMESIIFKEEAEQMYIDQHILSRSMCGVQEAIKPKERYHTHQRIKARFFGRLNHGKKDLSLFDFSPTFNTWIGESNY